MKRKLQTMTIPALTSRLRELSIEERHAVAERAGVPYNTVHKYAYDYNAPPNGSFAIVTKLWAALL